MNPTLAEYALSGAMLTAVAILMMTFVYVRLGNEGALRAARMGLFLLAGLLTISAWGLVQALVDSNFALAYVVQHSEKSLATIYKIAAFWAGQEGSMLFWAWVLSLMGAVVAWRLRKETNTFAAITVGTMAAVVGFFTCVMLFAGNPFALAAEHHTNGEGLNPQLQNLAMAAHPPLLFLGYAGFTVPFAYMLGGLIGREKETHWLALARPWMVFSWIALTVGIVLGAEWAYVELGWGGYWAWDPVENASLLPWLTGTALLHCVVLQARRGMFKGWTAFLTASSFFLCVLGTYLTRSGVIQSVHAFQESDIGKFFLVFLIFIGVVSVGTLLGRASRLKSEHAIESLVSREGFFLLANILLLVMTVTTLVGTIYPLLSNAVSGNAITVKAAFYNNVILPMALLLSALMATGPVLGEGANAFTHARNKLVGMLLFGIAGAIGCWMLQSAGMIPFTSPWALATAGVIAAVLSAVVMDLILSVQARLHDDAGIVIGLVRVITTRPRHWGAQIAHLGLAALIAGVAGSSIYGQSKNFELHPGAAPAKLGNYTLTLNNFGEVRRENHSAVVATIDLRDAAGRMFQLKPERRFYDAMPEQSASEVALRSGLFADLYMTLAGWEENGKTVTITAMINPMVNWIWIGGALLALGGLICLIPTTQRSPASSQSEDHHDDTHRLPATPHNARERRRLRRLQEASVERSHS